MKACPSLLRNSAWIVMACALMSVSCSADPSLSGPAESRGLEDYVGKPLRDSDALWEDVEELTGSKRGETEWMFGHLEARWVRPFRSGRAAWMLLEAYEGLGSNRDIPGVRVHVFSRDWELVARSAFPTGYGFNTRGIGIVRDDMAGQDLLRVSSDPVGPGVGGFFEEDDEPAPKPDFHLFYTLINDYFVTVRAEDASGKAVCGSFHYRHSYPECGPSVHLRTKEERLTTLTGNDVIACLDTLVWLTGDHLPSDHVREPDVSRESLEHSLAFEAVRDAPEARRLIQGLLVAKHPWIREYAAAALEVVK